MPLTDLVPTCVQDKVVCTVLYTEGWVCDIALIKYTLGLGKTQGGLGFWEEGYKGPMGDEGSQFTSNLGPRWTIPVTAGGCQVSREGISKGNYSKGGHIL